MSTNMPPLRSGAHHSTGGQSTSHWVSFVSSGRPIAPSASIRLAIAIGG